MTDNQRGDQADPMADSMADPLVARAAGLASSTLANALDDAGLHHHVIATIKAVSPGMRFAGPAITVFEVAGDYGDFTSEDFKIGAILEAAGPGDVIVVELGGAACSTWGGMASLAAKVKGVAGLLVDGGVRDLEEMIAFDFPVFARHLVPTTGRRRLKVEAIGESIEVDGVAVAPGDIIVADGSGAVCLPRADAEQIVTRAEALQRDDEAAVAEIQKGLSFAEAMKKFTRI